MSSVTASIRAAVCASWIAILAACATENSATLPAAVPDSLRVAAIRV